MMADLNSRRRLTSLIRVVAFPAVFGVAIMLVPSADAAIRHRYLFDTPAGAGGTFADSVGSATGTLFGNATVANGRLILPGGGAGITGDHARLDTALGTGVNVWTYNAFSFAAWASTSNINDTWARYYDIGFRNVPDTNAPNDSAANSIFATINAGGNFPTMDPPGPFDGQPYGARVAISNVASFGDPGPAGSTNENQANTVTLAANNQLHHVATTFDPAADVLRLYFNGTLVAENTMATHTLAALDFTGTPDRTNYALLGGALYGDPSFEGYMAQVEIYDHALTQTEVTNLFAAPPAGEGNSVLTISRDDGSMTLTRRFAAATNVVGYRITSGNGALVSSNWDPIADNFDDGGIVDDETWTVLTGSKGELAEFNFDVGNGGTFGATAIPIGGAGTWLRGNTENVSMTIKLANGLDENVEVRFVGNNVNGVDTPFRRSDLNLDNAIDGDDYAIFLANNPQTFDASLTDAETYLMGDINGDNVSNVADFRLFKQDYLAYQASIMAGGGASIFGSEVPEPATVSLVAVALSALGLTRRRRKQEVLAISQPVARKSVAAAAALVALFALAVNSADAALRNQYSFNAPAGFAPDGTVITDSVGGKHGVLRSADPMGGDPKASFTGTQLRLGSSTTAADYAQANGPAYVDLPNGLISSLSSDATFEAWFTVHIGTSWSRVFDFGDNNGTFAEGCTTAPCEITGPLPLPTPTGASAGDTLFVSNNTGGTGNTNTQRMAFENERAVTPGPAGGCLVDCAGTTGTSGPPDGTVNWGAFNTQRHLVVTFVGDADGAGPSTNSQMTWFINGQQVGTVNSPRQLRHLNDVNNWLGRSNYLADSHMAGSYNEFRIYDHALTANNIAINSLLGPDRPFSENILVLKVNSHTGQGTILNQIADLDVPFDYYRIASTSDTLSPSTWGTAGAGWDKGGESNVSELVEYYLGTPTQNGDSFEDATTDPDGRSIGKVFDPSVLGAGVQDANLTFQYGGPSGFLISGAIIWDNTPPTAGLGDYNLDGVVNAADYVVYRNRKNGVGGSSLPAGTDDTPGSVGTDDYLRWKNLYGTVYGSGSSIGGSEVPEPATLVSIVFGLAIAGIGCGRRRSVR